MAEILEIERTEDYALYQVKDEAFLPNTFIICSEAARQVLYSPHIVGARLQDAMEKNAEIFAKIAAKHVLAGVPKKNICELVFLSGGLYYFLNSGFKRIFGSALQQCFIGIQRQRIEGTEGQFRAIAGYENFEALPEKANVIIGDTVATGSTLIKGIQLLLDAAEVKGASLESITVFSLASSSDGVRRFARLAKSHILPQHPSCKLSFYACEMLFHLMPDGTDLRFLMPSSVMPPESMQEAKRRYGNYLAKNMRCAVFDWGTRCKNPIAHCKEFLHYAEKELESVKPDEKARSVLLKMKREVQQELSEMEKPL
ncbi:MAG: hypothetical protein N3G80_03345 [Candidatus Micrarchaeota archaeon]|nr:hypothetical protein [Candidatus Micrarchaeota archaeon]